MIDGGKKYDGSGVVNNIKSFFGASYLGCGQQARLLTVELHKLNWGDDLKLQWDFSIQSEYFPDAFLRHQFILAK
ncbi:hypothetical protein [Pseudoalteromonas arctica]|uniref:Uncharacterized protein n=1 Tax=Pseudoalteromonas arctica TaxID=394751 RepID=A0A7Y0HAY0_9GAMM|nr:hypothetical protein [Pseudoalteromonas arctica]NMM39788.1 hypothetical protein [Pseudoalteromonas arctica]